LSTSSLLSTGAESLISGEVDFLILRLQSNISQYRKERYPVAVAKEEGFKTEITARHRTIV
jgi:hypothetical protein